MSIFSFYLDQSVEKVRQFDNNALRIPTPWATRKFHGIQCLKHTFSMTYLICSLRMSQSMMLLSFVWLFFIGIVSFALEYRTKKKKKKQFTFAFEHRVCGTCVFVAEWILHLNLSQNCRVKSKFFLETKNSHCYFHFVCVYFFHFLRWQNVNYSTMFIVNTVLHFAVFQYNCKTTIIVIVHSKMLISKFWFQF